MKNCSNKNCTQINPQSLDFFYKSKKSKDVCKFCIKNINAIYYKNNKEKSKADSKAWRQANPEKVKANNKAHYKNNKEKSHSQSKAWKKDNPEKIRAGNRIYKQNNREKIINYEKSNPEKVKNWRKTYVESHIERVKATNKIWKKANPDKVNAQTARRRAKKLQATPKWLTERCHNQIETFYTEAVRLTKETGIPHHVDHIVPLQGKNVRGLHVPWNLQILTAKANISWGNRIKS